MQGDERGAVGMAWVWAGLGRAGQGLKRRAGAKAQERCNVGPFTDPVHSSMQSHDARIGGDPDTDAARRFRIGGSYKEKIKRSG